MSRLPPQLKVELPKTQAEFAITSVRRGPGGMADWLVSVESVCVDAPMRDRRLRSHKRFRNVMKYRFGVEYAPMPQDDWEAIVEAAIEAEGDGS